jgi:hypothetical protein
MKQLQGQQKVGLFYETFDLDGIIEVGALAGCPVALGFELGFASWRRRRVRFYCAPQLMRPFLVGAIKRKIHILAWRPFVKALCA